MTDSVVSSQSAVSPTLEHLRDHISEAIDRLRHLSQLTVQTGWRYHLGDLPIDRATQATTWNTWTSVTLNDRQHISWPKGRQVLWLGQSIQVPAHLHGYALEGFALRLALIWWAELAQIYVDGRLVQEGDLFDTNARILLSSAVRPGETMAVAIRLISPGHDDGALVRSQCLYEWPDQRLLPAPEPGFVADELAVLLEYSSTLTSDDLESLSSAVAALPWSVLDEGDRHAFDQALAVLRQRLQPLGNWVKQRQIRLLGHAHLDMAWLWPVRETWQAAERTFQSVLQLQKDFPELVFCHTTPALYAWMEQNRPDLLAAIQAQVAAGQWDISVAPLWIEPELNVVSGESIARQILYGQQYLLQTFGQLGTIAWLPDSFGFCWQLPQLLKQGAIDYFVTQKLRWNDTTTFPHEAFWWESPDGSRILSLHSAPIGEGIDPVKMARYACTWEQQTGLSTALWLPGVGDHGGGPTRDMLEVARRWQQSPFFPQLAFTNAPDFLKTLEISDAINSHRVESDRSNAAPPTANPTTRPLPVWNNELYLEFHRGCYTNHADQKRSNRRCEDALYEAELFSSINTLITGAPYPKAELEAAWKQVLFNQFHDILPGTAIPQVFEEANQAWERALKVGQSLRQQAMHAIAQAIQWPPLPHPQAQRLVVFNSLNWERSEVVEMLMESGETQWQIWDMQGQPVLSQQYTVQDDASTGSRLVFQAEQIPAIGYRCFWMVPEEANLSTTNPSTTNPSTANSSTANKKASSAQQGFELENECLQVMIDPMTGNLSRLFDKVHNREWLSGAGNELQAFDDRGQYWDAWNIDPQYAQHPLPPAKLLEITEEVRGDLMTRIRVIRQIGQSIFHQVYSLTSGSAVLKIMTRVDWQERHVVVKVAFPLQLQATYATYEIPCGSIQRPTHPTTDREKAQWEVPALRWADLSNTTDERTYGVSLLSDSKHGYDSQPNQLRLTLLRGSEWPDPDSDRGIHEFTYAVYPHDQDWRSAQTVRRGYELNQPLQVLRLETDSTDSAPLPLVGQFLNLSTNNLILTAFKPSEQDPTRWVLRTYECHGDPAVFSPIDTFNTLLGPALEASSCERANLLEQTLSARTTDVAREETSVLSPWSIATFTIALRA